MGVFSVFLWEGRRRRSLTHFLFDVCVNEHCQKKEGRLVICVFCRCGFRQIRLLL